MSEYYDGYTVEQLKAELAYKVKECQLLDKINPGNEKIADAASHLVRYVEDQLDQDGNFKGNGGWRINNLIDAFKRFKKVYDEAEAMQIPEADDIGPLLERRPKLCPKQPHLNTLGETTSSDPTGHE